MPETSLEDVLDTMDVMVEAENAAAQFYRTCAKKYAEDAQVWTSLAEEELVHAEALSKLSKLVRKKPHRFEPGNLSSLAVLRDFIMKTNAKIDSLTSGELMEADAFQIAFHIESTFIESKYPEVVMTDEPKYNQILDNLVSRSKEHKRILARKIKRIKAKAQAKSGADSAINQPEKPAATRLQVVKEVKEEKHALREENSPTDVYSGHVQGVDILEYLQFVLLTGRSTVLRLVATDGTEAKLHLSGGKVVHAVRGKIEGEDAFYQSMQFKGGSFSHLPWEEPPRASIDKIGDLLLLEAARRRDEAKPAGT
jgi:Domain of unknown function (DUF4388)